MYLIDKFNPHVSGETFCQKMNGTGIKIQRNCKTDFSQLRF